MIHRRAPDKAGTVYPPMTLGNMRANGVRRVYLTCASPDCGWRASVAVTKWPDDFPVPYVGARIACPACGAREVDSQPDWNDRGPK